MNILAYQSLVDRRPGIGVLHFRVTAIFLHCRSARRCLDLSNADLQRHGLVAGFESPEQKLSGTNRLDVSNGPIEE